MSLGKGAEALRKSIGGSRVSDRPTSDTLAFLAGFPGAKYEEISISLIDRSPYQPRLRLSHDRVAHLAKSIQAGSLIEPLIVRPKPDGRFELISGENRLMALRSINEEVTPAIVRPVSDDEAMRMALIDNVAREQLTDFEQGLSYRRLVDEQSLSQQAIAELVSLPRSHVQRCLKLAELPDSVQAVLKENPDLIGATVGNELLNRCVDGFTELVIEGLKKLSVGEIPYQGELTYWIDHCIDRLKHTASSRKVSEKITPTKLLSGISYKASVHGQVVKIAATCPTGLSPEDFRKHLEEAMAAFSNS